MQHFESFERTFSAMVWKGVQATPSIQISGSFLAKSLCGGQRPEISIATDSKTGFAVRTGFAPPSHPPQGLYDSRDQNDRGGFAHPLCAKRPHTQRRPGGSDCSIHCRVWVHQPDPVGWRARSDCWAWPFDGCPQAGAHRSACDRVGAPDAHPEEGLHPGRQPYCRKRRLG